VLTEATKVMGTPRYMSPEQIQTPGEADHRADIFALGVVFYQMLTGEPPGQQLEPPSKKVHVDVRLDEVVLRALEKKPELRYQQASVLKTEVETIAATSLGSNRREEAQTRKEKPGESPLTSAPTNQEAKGFANIAFGLFLTGTLGSLWLLTFLQRPEIPMVAFGGMALILALILGLISWRERLGKFVAVATSMLLVTSAIVAAIFFLAYAPRRQAQMEQERQSFATDRTQQGWQLWRSRKLAAAEGKFKQAIDTMPGNANAWNGLGWSQLNSGKSAAAEASFKQAIAIEPTQPGSLNGLGQIYLSQLLMWSST
jgi:hypothetical protein